MTTIFDTWTKAAELRARDYYAACVARSKARRETGGPTLAEMSLTRNYSRKARSKVALSS